MKMKIGTALPEGYQVSHEDLSESMTALIAHYLLPLFAENMPDAMAKANVKGIVTELAYLFDEGEIEIGGKIYRPRIAFVDNTGATLPGFNKVKNFHEMVDDPFDIAPEAKITFEDVEFDAD
ncbi:hypothetical protein [Yoonia sediminilitoris]|uniref:Uncharacterized protein n=1 Tax=Yoonia sediminilitoris TaxID=1286148 RepID=A0A2T6KQL9_9RHOB|nr:hypothetical protein [Yoonia sediminilitoris]PUB18842.1 hypothetical protein C8N45_101431 [Yoonia sediminilitoris]RCW99010.1 hypothetical protein DFP92_101431 [Yoonia sediminilitoris]